MNLWLKRISKRIGILVGVLALVAVGLFVIVQITWDRPVIRPTPRMVAAIDEQSIARGEYLYKYSLNCWTCHGSQGGHSPDDPQAGGQVFDMTDIGPPGGFGYVYASNITPDQETGIGTWTDGELVRAVREGLDKEGHTLFPIMEAEWWSGLSDADALALVAYIRTLPAVYNEVPDNQLTFMTKALITLGIVKAQPAITEPIVAPPRGVAAEYGEYLVYHAAACVGCHTPRNPNNGQFDLTQPFAGGLFPFPEKDFTTTGSNLTPDPVTGIGNWTEEQFITAMQRGLRPDGSVILPFMPWPAYNHWSTDDLRAVWLYLRSLDPITHEVPASSLTGVAATGEGADRGEGLFNVYCVVCHGEKGSGSPFTNIALEDVAVKMDDAALVRFITKSSPGISMPGFGKTLTDEQIEDLVAFIRTW